MTLVVCNSCIIHILNHASINTVTHHDVLTALYMSVNVLNMGVNWDKHNGSQTVPCALVSFLFHIHRIVSRKA